MVSAVVLAGGNTKPSRWDRLRQIRNRLIYGETYLWDTFKPLTLTRVRKGGVIEVAPLVSHGLQNLCLAKTIEDIVVPTEVEMVAPALEKISFGKHIEYVQQGDNIYDNIMIGYAHTQAAKRREPALFVPCDLPLVTPEMYDSFVEKCLPLASEFDFVYAIIGKESITKRTSLMSRIYYSFLNLVSAFTGREAIPKEKRLYFKPFFWCEDDTFKPEYQETRPQNLGNNIWDCAVNFISAIAPNPYAFDVSRTQRRGFRVANMGYCDPTKVMNGEKVNVVYAGRKLRDLVNLARAGAYFTDETVSYFRGRLKVSEIVASASAFLGTRFKLMEVTYPEMEADVDSREDLRELG